jgi:hypothetical protein
MRFIIDSPKGFRSAKLHAPPSRVATSPRQSQASRVPQASGPAPLFSLEPRIGEAVPLQYNFRDDCLSFFP